MAVFTKSSIIGHVAFLGVVEHRPTTLESVSVDTVALGYDGFEGEFHGGLTRPSCSRVSMIYPKGTEIKNARQISILSQEELELIAQDMAIDAIDPRWLGANLVTHGIPDLSKLPSSTRLRFPSGAVLVVDVENGPCRFPAEIIDTHHQGAGPKFIPAARDRRGVVAWVERPGAISHGDTIELFLPPKNSWNFD